MAPGPTDDPHAAASDLKDRYVDLMDGRRWDEWAALFTTDAILDAREDMAVHGFPPEHGVVRGRDRIVAGSRAALDGTRSVHRVSDPVFEAVGSDRVRVTWAMIDRIEHPDGRVLEGRGTYHDEYVRIDGRWYIDRIRLTRTDLAWRTPAE